VFRLKERKRGERSYVRSFIQYATGEGRGGDQKDEEEKRETEQKGR
jgi:hypothetical protein